MADLAVILCHQTVAQLQTLAAGWKLLLQLEHQDLVESLAARYPYDERLCLHLLMMHFEQLLSQIVQNPLVFLDDLIRECPPHLQMLLELENQSFPTESLCLLLEQPVLLIHLLMANCLGYVPLLERHPPHLQKHSHLESLFLEDDLLHLILFVQAQIGEQEGLGLWWVVCAFCWRTHCPRIQFSTETAHQGWIVLVQVMCLGSSHDRFLYLHLHQGQHEQMVTVRMHFLEITLNYITFITLDAISTSKNVVEVV
jgi:hypothetical protein